MSSRRRHQTLLRSVALLTIVKVVVAARRWRRCFILRRARFRDRAWVGRAVGLRAEGPSQGLGIADGDDPVVLRALRGEFVR